MPDRISKEKRSWNMSKIKGKDTSLELKVRKYLWTHGYRYRKNVSSLPGKPDIAIKKYKIAIFINGCFWHHHSCKLGYMPKSNVEFWKKKFEINIANDAKHEAELTSSGYTIMVLWECSLKDNFEYEMEQLCKTIDSKREKYMSY